VVVAVRNAKFTEREAYRHCGAMEHNQLYKIRADITRLTRTREWPFLFGCTRVRTIRRVEKAFFPDVDISTKDVCAKV